MTNSLRERRRQMLQDEILDTALIMLVEKGYVTMSMDDLASRIGISKPTLYTHFATKDALVMAAALRALDRLIGLIEAREEGQTPLQRLTTLLRTIVQFQIDRGLFALRPVAPELFQLMCERKDVIDRLNRIDSEVVSLIRAGVAAGEIDARLNPTAVARAYYALANALKFAPLGREDDLDPATATDTLVEMFVRGVRAQPDALPYRAAENVVILEE